MLQVLLFKNAQCRISIEGESAAAEFRLTRLVRWRPDAASGWVEAEAFVFDEPLVVPAALVVHAKPEFDPQAADDEMAFKPSAAAPLGLTLIADLFFGAQGTFFGKRFNLEAGVSAQLIINLPPPGQALPLDMPFMALTACGAFEVTATPATFSSEVFCFQAAIVQPPTAFPSAAPPTFSVTLPDFGFELPSLNIPWPFPDFPSFPLALPPFAGGGDTLPLSVSWQAVRVQATATEVVIDFKQLSVRGKGPAVEGDLHLVLVNGKVDQARTRFDLYLPDFTHRLSLPISEWYFDERCVALRWDEPHLNALLKLVAPDFAEVRPAGGTQVTLRLLREGLDFSEVRLDWQAGGAAKTYNLPGFDIDFPPVRMYSLVLALDQESAARAMVMATLEADKTIKASSSFTLLSSDQRERFNNAGDAQKKLVEFQATTQKPLSLVLLDLPFGGGSAQFFQQLAQPLEPLVLNQGHEATCQPTGRDFRPLSQDDWKDVKLNFNFDGQPGDFDLPILRKRPGGDDPHDQVIKIKRPPNQSLQLGQEIKCPFDIDVCLDALTVHTQITLLFDLKNFAFKSSLADRVEFKLREPVPTGEFLKLRWRFEPSAAPDGLMFILAIKDSNYRLQQAPGSRIVAEFTQATTDREPIAFELRDFALTPRGMSVAARVIPSPVTLNGLETRFRFTEGAFRIEENRLKDFSISGSGPLPPKLVGDAIADISLQFGVRRQEPDGEEAVQIICGVAQLRGKNLLSCKGTRFEFAVDGLGLKFVFDGGYHFYFTITGRAKFKPLAGDDNSGPLAWLPAIEMQLVECPLTGDARVIAKHVRFLVEMPRKVRFDFLGCFKMELRGIGFVPQALMFDEKAAAMELSGQVMFADGAGDLIDARFDFHSLFIGLPAPGQCMPRIHFKEIAIHLQTGDAFDLEGLVEYIDGEIEPGLKAKGFAGKGSLTIKGLPTFTAAFTFVRISRDGGVTWQRAWFLYVQAGKLSLRIPVINVFIREIGLGFGYRYTLASIKTADELDDPRQLLAALKKLSLTQGELSRRDQWRVDLENPGESARWTVAARALIAQSSAAGGVTDWNEASERELPSLFVMDIVLGLRSDLTFLMAGRAWLNTNYNDYLTKESLRSRPLFSGFVLLSPRKGRFLANLSSNPGAEFGDHPPLPGFLKKAILESRFSATLLIEPGLLHFEIGWPNMLRWGGNIGPLKAEFRGGAIFRVSRRELVIGNSYMARGSLELHASVGGYSLGASLSATANVAYGGRYIGVIGFDDPRGRSALYGAVGVEINVDFRVEFWLRLKIGFFKISIELSFSFAINITALLEVGVTVGDLIGVRGRATVSLSIMGRGLHFNIQVGINEGAVNAAFSITEQYLHIGLEASEVDPVPGSRPQLQAGPGGPNALLNDPPHGIDMGTGVAVPAAEVGHADAHVEGQPADAPPTDAPHGAPPDNAPPDVAPQPVAGQPTGGPANNEVLRFKPPNDYAIFTIPPADAGGNPGTNDQQKYYCLLLPGAKPHSDGKQGFLPVPPRDGTVPTQDFSWTGIPMNGLQMEHYLPGTGWQPVNGGARPWKAKWEQPVGRVSKHENPQAVEQDSQNLTLAQLMVNAFIPKADVEDPRQTEPKEDPTLPPSSEDVLEDARVHNPSDDAFEAAVRGAAQQFAGSPYFKPDPKSVYEQKLAQAYSADTTIYSANGKVEGDQSASAKAEQAIQLRSVIINRMISDLQDYVALLRAGQTGPANDLVDKSLAFQMGLVFCTSGRAPSWYTEDGNPAAGQITQRNSPTSPNPESDPITVTGFNKSVHSYHEQPPQFQRIKQYTDASTVAITWDLIWPESNFAAVARPEHDWHPEQKNPDHLLKHYVVRRRSLADGDEEEFHVKPVDALNLIAAHGPMEIAGNQIKITSGSEKFNEFRVGQKVKITGARVAANNGIRVITGVEEKRLTFKESFANEVGATLSITSLQLLKSRFCFVDHFSKETAEDLAALPPAGKTYVYTITPVDVTGTPSPRPLTLLATRFPNEPSQVPSDGQLIVSYELEAGDYNPAISAIKRPKAIRVEWTEPADAAGKPHVAIAEWRLVFRREAVFPLGSYGIGGESQGSRASGLPTSNARRLRTDIVLSLTDVRGEFDPQQRQRRMSATIPVDDPSLKRVLPDGEWRPEAWRVFFQTQSTGKVESALTPVEIILRFTAKGRADGQVERRPSLLEWLARPIAFAMLPPEDEKAEVDFAYVPMPAQPAAATDTVGQWVPAAAPSNVTFTDHPDRLRSVRFDWNQGPSDQTSASRLRYPVELTAGYRLYEFDLDAHTAEVLDRPGNDFLAHLRRAQELEILPSEALTLTPANTLTANQWEAWYPSAVRRRWLFEHPLDAQTIKIPPKFSRAKMNPWFSWRDSYLVWPDDKGLFVRDAIGGDSIVGMMKITNQGEQFKVEMQSGGFDSLKTDQTIRLYSSYDARLNGEKRIASKVDNKTLLFAKDAFKSFDGQETPTHLVVIDPLTAPRQADSQVTGIMEIDNDKAPATGQPAQKLKFSTGGLSSNFKPGQYVRITGAYTDSNNGIKRVKQVVSDKELIFEPDSFQQSEPVTAGESRDKWRAVAGKMSILLPAQPDVTQIKCAAGGLDIFKPGQAIKVCNRTRTIDQIVHILTREKAKQVSPDDDEPITPTRLLVRRDELNSPVTDDEITLHAVTLTVDGSPLVGLHPALAMMVEDLDDAFIVVDLNPPPAAAPSSLSGLLGQTAPAADPYGWNILKHMGLAVTFCLRERSTGNPLSPQETQARLGSLIKKYKDDKLDKALLRHLFIDYLFQPAKSVRLKSESKEVSNKELLALVQISLRPATQQIYQYFMVTWDLAKTDHAAESSVVANIDPQGGELTFIELTRNTTQQSVKGTAKKITLVNPPTKQPVLLLRWLGPVGQTAPTFVMIEAAPAPVIMPFSPSDWQATYFTAPADNWPQPQGSLDNDASRKAKEEVARQWLRFRRYLLRVNPPNPGSTTDARIDLPVLADPNDAESVKNLMSWLDRFFENAGDIPSPRRDGTDLAPDRPLPLGATPDGPWVATAYPRALSPVGVVPDSAGRMTYYHLIEDRLAHVYRYYFLPSGRYDRLWQALAESEALYKKTADKPQPVTFTKPLDAEGGLDVVIDRILDLAPPLVLFSGRLDRRLAPGQIAPPGKTWEVIVAKHPEQLLVERNRTLARQLDYRHVAHTLVRRFAFVPALMHLDREMQRFVTQTPRRGDSPINTTGAMAEIIIQRGTQSKPFDINLAGRNHLNGLSEAINQLADQIASDTGVRLQAKVVQGEVEQNPSAPFPPDYYLALTVKERTGEPAELSIQLRAEKGNAASQLLGAAFSPAAVQPVAQPANPPLPGEYPEPESLPLGQMTADQFLSIDLPARLGTFGKSAVVLQWEALPYFYEHRLLLVAQTSAEVVSEVTSLTQRDFEYQSPTPFARLEGVARQDDPERALLAYVKLGNHWDCLPDEARRRWPAEAPATDRLTVSALPDTEVLYQIVLAYDDGLIETQAELFFDTRPSNSDEVPEPASGYRVRQSGRRFFVAPLRVLPPDRRKEFYLLVRLSKVNQLNLPEASAPLGPFQGDLTRSRYNELVLNQFQGLAKLLPASPTPAQKDRVVRRWVGATTVSQEVDLGDLRDKLAFITASGDHMLACQTPLNEQEKIALRSKFVVPADQAAIEKLGEEITNRQAIDQYLRGWVSEQAVSSRKRFSSATLPADRLEFPAPLTCQLVLDLRGMDAGQFEATRQALRRLLADSPDNSFGNAVARLLAELEVAGDSRPFLSADAGVGVEQIMELSDRAAAGDGKVVWRGAVDQEQLTVLAQWVALSDFGDTFAALLKQLHEPRQMRFRFDSSQPHPSTDQVPAVLATRLAQNLNATTPAESEVVWTGLLLLPEEAEALESLKSGFGATFTLAISSLLDALRGVAEEPQARTEVAIKTPDWRPRLETDQLNEALRGRLLIGKGRLRFYGWMTREEARQLSELRPQAHPDRASVERLFDEAMTRGMDGGHLSITARRGAAGIKSAAMAGNFKEE